MEAATPRGGKLENDVENATLAIGKADCKGCLDSGRRWNN